MMNDLEGAYTKTQAYNFLKNLLGVSKKIIINKTFFSLFFKEYEGMYLIRKSEDSIKRIFTEEGIAEFNKMYYKMKQRNKPLAAQRIAKEVMKIVKKSLAA